MSFPMTTSCHNKERATRVTFHSRVLIRLVLHKNDMERHERERYWLTIEEHSRIKADCHRTLRRMKENEESTSSSEGEGSIVDNNEFCSRGLECRTKEGRMRKTSNKESVWSAVFLQQKVQQQEGIDDPDFIAAVSVSKTRHCVATALETGIRDEQEARLQANGWQ